MSTNTLPSAMSRGTSGPSAQSLRPGAATAGRRLALGLLALSAVALGGCVAPYPYNPTGVVYAPAPGPAGTTSPQGQVATGEPQVVRSVQVPQASLPPNGGFSVSEILTQVKSGRPVAEVAADIRGRGLNAPLKQADVDMLATNGVPKEVVDAALAAPVNTATVDNPQVVTRAYYYYPWVPFTLGLYWGAWRPFYYPYYAYTPRFYGRAYYGHSWGGGWGGRSGGHGGGGWGGHGGRR